MCALLLKGAAADTRTCGTHKAWQLQPGTVFPIESDKKEIDYRR